LFKLLASYWKQNSYSTLCIDVAETYSGITYGHVFLYLHWQGWPAVHPDILVATPAALLNYLFDYDPEKRRRERFMRNVKFVVSTRAKHFFSIKFIFCVLFNHYLSLLGKAIIVVSPFSFPVACIRNIWNCL